MNPGFAVIIFNFITDYTEENQQKQKCKFEWKVTLKESSKKISAFSKHDLVTKNRLLSTK